MTKTEKVFYEHYLRVEKERRADALSLFERKEHTALRHSRYLSTVNHEAEIDGNTLESQLANIDKIKATLLDNVGRVYIDADYIEGPCFGGTSIVTELKLKWSTFRILGEDRCKSLARHWARDAAWKMKHQPNGKNGKAAAKLYKELTDGDT